MYEFNGWAVVEADVRSEENDRELFDALKEYVATLPEATRGRVFFPDTILNGFRSLTVSGLRNHCDSEILWLFEWLAARSRHCYGLLYVRNDEVLDPRDMDRFFVWRLANGEVTYHDDPFFG
ncbi:MAG TPA: Imm7 family immunity protein [Longimicrobium sp.]|nr:Imm7 family immunity protein [Longimicrobium sp.]